MRDRGARPLAGRRAAPGNRRPSWWHTSGRAGDWRRRHDDWAVVLIFSFDGCHVPPLGQCPAMGAKRTLSNGRCGSPSGSSAESPRRPLRAHPGRSRRMTAVLKADIRSGHNLQIAAPGRAASEREVLTQARLVQPDVVRAGLHYSRPWGLRPQQQTTEAQAKQRAPRNPSYPSQGRGLRGPGGRPAAA